MHRYEVVCTVCNASRVVEIHDTPVGKRIDWLETLDKSDDPICSGRFRLDGNFGWQCRKCGTNDILTRQELHTFTNPVNPKPQEIRQIVENLIPDMPKFEMRAV